jgi:hypothetical protein
LLFLIVCICSLYLVLNVRPVCPTYFNGQSIHIIWYTPLCSYRLGIGEDLLGFVLYFCSECNLNICLFEEFYDFFCFFSVVRKNCPFCCLVLWACIFVQWLRLALSKGPNWVGVFSPTFTWGRKQIQFPKCRVL